MGVILRRNRQDLIKTAEDFNLRYNGLDFSNNHWPNTPILNNEKNDTPSDTVVPPAPTLRRSTRIRRQPYYLNDYVIHRGSLIKKMI